MMFESSATSPSRLCCPLEIGVRHRGDDRLLAGEVVIEVPGTDAGLGADRGRGGAVKAVPRKAARCRLQDFLAFLRVFDWVDLAHGSSRIS